MKLLLDTNILLYLSKQTYSTVSDVIINSEADLIYISVITLGELKSIALQNDWGPKKWKALETILTEAVIIEISENLLDSYSQIDAFSQRRNKFHTTYDFKTPRNMGKNDLWIAATASLLGLTLVTADNDFNHLHKIFFQVRLVIPT